MPTSSSQAVPLQTRGCLRLGHVQEPKPLLLLAYLLIEGATPRDRLARLLWPDSSDPRNNLRVSLCKLRGWGVTVTTDGDCLSAEHPSDHRTGGACGAGAGFLRGVELAGVSPELEDWVLGRREELAAQTQETLLREAAPVTDRDELLDRAWHLPDAPLPSAATLARFLSLCRAGTALHGSLSEELADLWDGTLPTREPLVQALLAGWLEGGVTWLAGDAAQWRPSLDRVRALLEADGQRVLSLHVPPGVGGQRHAQELEDQLTQACRSAAPRTLTVILTGAAHALAAALPDTLAGWPDVRFLVLGGVPAAGEGLILTLPDYCDGVMPGRAAGAERTRTRPAGTPLRALLPGGRGPAGLQRRCGQHRPAHGATGPPRGLLSARPTVRSPTRPDSTLGA